MIYFPFKYQNRIITKQNAIDLIDFAIKFIENHFNCNLEKYRTAIDVLSKLNKAINGITDHNIEKQKRLLAIDVLTEIAELTVYNDSELRKIREAAAFVKLSLN